jgi:hypothetical protein
MGVLKATGSYTQDPATAPNVARFCGQADGTLNDPFVPDSGSAVYYLVTGMDSAEIEGSARQNSSGLT